MIDRPPYRILVVDDEPDFLVLHASYIKALGYDVETAADGIETLEKLPLDIDMILLDGKMPGMDGFEVARRIRSMPEYSYVPIVMATGLTKPEDRRRALEVVINDFVTKPLDPQELGLRARWLLDFKAAHDRLAEHKSELERSVERKTKALRHALEETSEAKRLIYEGHLDTICRLTIAAEYRDHATASHIERVGLCSEIVAAKIGLSPGEVETIRHAAQLHDVGKIGIPDHLLLKPGPLDDDEWVIIRSHAAMGAQILTQSTSPVMQMGEKIALAHHEKWDGSGYPNGIAGDLIPLEARICAVVDVYDAITMDRPYRPAFSKDHALEMMRKIDGSHFDPEVLNAFLESLDDIREVQTAHR